MDIKDILRLHSLWVNGSKGGVQADLRGADLRGANLYEANLREANLRGSDLCGADLCGADLHGADLRRTEIISFYYKKHQAFLHIGDQYPQGNILIIGCKELSLQEWLIHGREIAREEIYSKEEENVYMLMIKTWHDYFVKEADSE